MDSRLAEDLWTRGAGHLIGAQALVEEAKKQAIQSQKDDIDRAVFNGKYSAAIHLLVGFAFELLLKSAYLLHRGNPRKLNRDIGHNLVTALDEAEGAGFRSSIEHLRWVVENLDAPHNRHYFRYGGLDTVQMPVLELSLPTLETLAREIGASLFEGRIPEFKK